MMGAELQRMTHNNICPAITVSRINEASYWIVVRDPETGISAPINQPDSDAVHQFESLDQVAEFLSKVGVASFQVEI
jgi:hypothetical protein